MRKLRPLTTLFLDALTLLQQSPAEYVTRHDRIGQYLHWNICCHYEIPHPKNCYEDHPQPVTEGDNFTILWDFTIHTDMQINANRPGIVIKDLKQKTCILIDMSVPADRNISVKEYGKFAKYKDLEIEINRMWHLRTITLPTVVGALGMLKKGSSSSSSSKHCTNVDSPSKEIPFNVVIDLRNHQNIMTLGQLSRRTVMT